METGQHPQLLAFSVVTATDLTLRVPPTAAGGSLEHFGGKPLDLPPTQLLGHHGALTLLELQESLVVVSLKVVGKIVYGVPPPAPPTSSALTNQVFFKPHQRRDGSEHLRHPAGLHVGIKWVVALLMKMMVVVMMMLLVSAVQLGLLAVKLSLEASGQRLVFLHL